MEQSDKKGLITSFIVLAATGIVSAFIPVVVLIVPITVSILYNRFDLKYAIVGYLTFLVLCFLLTNQLIAVLFICLSLPVSICTSYMIKTKERMKTSIIACIGSVFLGFVIYIVYISATQGMSVTQFVFSIINEFLISDENITKGIYVLLSDSNAYLEYYVSGVIPSEYANVSIEAMRNYISEIAIDAINTGMPTTIVVYSLLGGFLSYYIACLRLKKHNVPIARIQPFEMLTIPRTEINMIFLMALISIVFSFMGADIFGYASNIFLAVFMVAFGVQGYSVIYFYYKKKAYPMVICILLFIVATLIGVAFWVGFFDNIFKLRMRYIIGNQKGGGGN